MMKDGQGNEIVINRAYQWVFAMPGPDVTTGIAKSINDDGTVTLFDVHFKFDCDMKPHLLFQPLTFGWHQQDLQAISEHGGEIGCRIRADVEGER